MSIIVMHLRWNHTSPEQVRLAEAHLNGPKSPPSDGCYSLRLQKPGDTLLLTTVWESEEHARAFARERLAQVINKARLAEPQTAVFAVPDLFAPGYRVTPAAPTSAVPVPRKAADLTVTTAP